MSLKHAPLACGVALLLTACAAPARYCFFPSSFNGLCVEAMQAGRLDEAERHCDDGLALFLESAELWTSKGEIALRRRDFPKAKEHFLHSLDLDAYQPFAYLELASIHQEEGTPRATEADLQECVRLMPDADACREGLTFVQDELASGALRP